MTNTHATIWFRRALALLAIGLLGAAAPAFAASPSSDGAKDARDAALANAVTLDMDLVTRINHVATQTNTALQDTCLLGHGTDHDKTNGLVACGDTLDKDPAIKPALVANKLTGRQFALGYSALIAAVIGGRGVMENATEGWQGVRELGINPEHVRFYIAHHAEIDRLEAATDL